MNFCKFLLVVGLTLSSVAAYANHQNPKVIYGNDDRKDMYEITDQRVLKVADSTVALFPDHAVAADETGATFKLNTVHYGKDYSLCTDERFYDQGSGAFCSGSLVGPDLVLTAGHCISTQAECDHVRLVFGFQANSAETFVNQVPTSEVYGCTKIEKRVYEGVGADFALIRLDRRVPNHTPLKINRKGKIKEKTDIFVVGHPAGLPRKVAGGAKVREANNGFIGIGKKDFFVANLDTYGGNSGSGVFNLSTGEIEGVLVRGESDFESRPGAACRQSKRCADDGCSGEDVTKIKVISEYIPE